MKYRKKPVVIEAFEFVPLYGQHGVLLPNEPHLIPLWFTKARAEGMVQLWDEGEQYCMIQTLEGRMKANAGDYIVLGVKGEIYPCKPDIFEMTYEKI